MESKSNILTQEEYKLVYKEYLRMILPSAILFLILLFINIVYSSLNKSFGLYFYMFLFVSIFISWILFNFITRQLQADLKQKYVVLEQEVVQQKVYKKDYEAGSAAIPVNLFSFLFIKKIAKMEMKELHICYLVVKDEIMHVDKSLFDKIEIGDTIIIRRAHNTKLFLGVEIV